MRVAPSARQQLSMLTIGPEFYLVGTIGDLRILSLSIRNLIAAPVREHSRKPTQLHDNLERLYAGPRCELFARAPRVGWNVWGNQTGKLEAD